MIRLKEFDNIRGIAIIAVIMIHIGAGILLVEPSTHTLKVPMSTFFVYHQLTGFAVSAFITCSGILLCMRYKDKQFNYLNFVGSRSLILIPYVIWSLIYLEYTGKLAGISKADLFTALGNGSAYWHLYFIPLVYCLYLLFPLFRFVVRKIKTPWWLVLALVLQHYFQIRLQNAVSKEVLDFFQVRFFLFLFLAGCYIGQYYDEFKAFINKYINAIIALLGTVLLLKICVFYYTALVLKKTVTEIPQTVTFENKLYTLCIIVLFIYLAPHLKSSLLGRFGANSFGIYLSHPLILKILYAFFKELNLINLRSEGAFAVLVITLFASYLLTEGLNRVPLGYLLIGRNDRPINIPFPAQKSAAG